MYTWPYSLWADGVCCYITALQGSWNLSCCHGSGGSSYDPLLLTICCKCPLQSLTVFACSSHNDGNWCCTLTPCATWPVFKWGLLSWILQSWDSSSITSLKTGLKAGLNHTDILTKCSGFPRGDRSIWSKFQQVNSVFTLACGGLF